MSLTYDELKHKKVDELREIAKGIEHEAVKGYTQLNKEHLLEAICKALDIDMHVHKHVAGLNKGALKKKIRQLKSKRDELLSSKSFSKNELKDIRRDIHHLKNKLRRSMVKD